jgi:hypothetical protein
MLYMQLWGSEREDFEKHLARGAKRVISCVPQKTPPDITVVMGSTMTSSNRVVDLIEMLAAVF